MKKLVSSLLGIFAAISLFSCGNNAHVHSYSEPNWVWNNYTSATATFVCNGCGEQISLVDDDIVCYDQPKKSCFIDGVWNYIASVNLDGKTYTSKKTITDPAPNKHGILKSVPFDDEYHEFRCVDCNEVVGNKAVHSYGDYVIKKLPTYTQEGSKERTCSECGHIQVTPISKLKLSYTEIKAEFDKIKNIDSKNMYADSYFKDVLTKYSYADLDNFTQEQRDEINGLKSDVDSRYATWKTLFGLLFDAEYMGYNDVKMTPKMDYVSDKGNVVEIKSTLAKGEAWAYSIAMPKDVSDYAYISFSIYIDQPMNMLVMNTNWTQSLDILTDTYYEGGKVHETQVLKTKQWVTFTISKANWQKMDDVYICVYLSYDLDYGIRTTGQPAFLSNIYGIKDEYYKDQVEVVKNVINDLPSATSLTAFSGSVIQNARDKYNALPDSLKPQVTNYNTLVNIENEYNSKWGVSFQMKSNFENYPDFGGDFEIREAKTHETYGSYVRYKINNADYALSFELNDKVTAGFTSVTFAVKSSESVKFSLTKNYWWTDGYDFSTNSMYVGDALSECSYYLPANQWTVLTLSASSFAEINMVQLISGVVKSSFDLSITSFYGVK